MESSDSNYVLGQAVPEPVHGLFKVHVPKETSFV
jgi:hypothetical protein